MKDITIDQEYLEKYANASWMETHTGRQFYPAKPRVEDLTIFDIAHALSLSCRYNGHTKQFYSVAEHCNTLALYSRYMGLPVVTQLQMLMHDGNEAYLPDVPRPIKHFFPELILMEKNLDRLIRGWLELPDEMPALVKEFDSRIIVDERKQVLFRSPHEWQVDHLKPLNVTLGLYGPAEAEARFLQTYQQLTREHLGRHVLLAYDDGEFAGKMASDTLGYQAPNIQLIDLLGKCALVKDADGFPYYINGDFSLA